MPNNDEGEQDLVEVMQGSDSGDISAKFESEEDSIENGCSTPNSTMKATMTAGCGTPSHMAPEVWLSMQGSFKHKKVVKFSKKVDVYSFGLVMWEALELNIPWKDVKFTFKVSQLVCSGKRPEISTGSKCHDDSLGGKVPAGFVDLMKRSWSANPSDRPDFGFLTNKFKAFYKTMMSGRKVSVDSVELSESSRNLLKAADASRKSRQDVISSAATEEEKVGS